MPNSPESLQNALASRYSIEREIGRGGNATVFLARDVKHDRPVAVKVLRPELSSAVGTERFLREVKIAARLQHPHILPLYDSGEASGYLFYVMPYVEGETVRQRLRREMQLPIGEAIQISREVATALSYAHDRGIVHRDVKPENILLSGGYALVADFGIAHALSEAGGEHLTETGIAVGTPAYMSPEQLRDDAHLDGRSDLYSLGCVLYEMLAGHPPFTGPSARVIMARHALDPPPPLRTARATVPELVEWAVTKSLAKVPADRFTTGDQFVRALTAPVEGEIPSLITPLPISVQKPSLFSELKRRRVYQSAFLYLAIAFGAVEGADMTFPVLGFPAWAYDLVVFGAIMGFPVNLVLSWTYDLTAKGLRRTAPWSTAQADRGGTTPAAAGMTVARTPTPPHVWTPPTPPQPVTPPPHLTTPSQPAAPPHVDIPPQQAAPSPPQLAPPPQPVTPEGYSMTPPGYAVPAEELKEPPAVLTRRRGLALLLGVAFLVNWAETTAEGWINAQFADLMSQFRHQTAFAVHWLEGTFSFAYHDVTNSIALYGYSTAYFFVFPALLVAVAVALGRRKDISPFRVYSLAILVDYLVSLPFFIFFPVPERWAYSESGAMLLSDRWSSTLIEAVRPISGLDNCFPSFHVSLSVVVVLVSFVYRLRFRWTVAALATTVILSTFVLGIHWVADIVAGIAVGAFGVFTAQRLDIHLRKAEQGALP